MNKFYLLIGIVLTLIIVAGGYVLILPAFVVTEADDPSPLSSLPESSSSTETDQNENSFDEQMDELSNVVIEQNMPMPNEASVLFSGEFMGTVGHPVSGTSWLIEDGSERILRFEDFSTINGPELHIYLATDTSASDYVDLGVIKATKGNVNYVVPSNVDVSVYDHVLVWCEPFGVLFGFSLLK